MDGRTLGRDGPDISVVGYGAWEAGGSMWGPAAAEDRVTAAIQAAVEAGMTWIDTAEVYGRGRSEELAGRALQRHGPEVLVFTKFGPRSPRGESRSDQVHRSIRASLERLGRDHVDLYQVHWPDDESVPIEDTWQAMAEVQDQGLARWIGVSNCDRSLIERCHAVRAVQSVQNQFSLLHQDDRSELLPWLQSQGIGYLAYGPLAFGLLTGAITRETTFTQEDWRSGWQGVDYYQELFAPGRLEPSLDNVGRLHPIAERLNMPLAAVAIRWAVDVPGVTAAIAGSTNPDHVRDDAAADSLRLDDDGRREIEEIFV